MGYCKICGEWMGPRGAEPPAPSPLPTPAPVAATVVNTLNMQAAAEGLALVTAMDQADDAQRAEEAAALKTAQDELAKANAYLASIPRPAQEETPPEVPATVETPEPEPQTPKRITLKK